MTPAETQRAYRVFLDALTRPGSIHTLPETDTHPWEAGIVTLADFLTPVTVFGDKIPESVRTTGADVVKPESARFALGLRQPTLPELRSLPRGTARAPHTACVLFQGVNDFDGGIELTLRGPGIKDSAELKINGVSERFIDTRNEMCADFPLGIDIFFITPTGQVAGLPRTTEVS